MKRHRVGKGKRRSVGGLKWRSRRGDEVQAALSYTDDGYVISHRPNNFTLSYRPKIPGDRFGSTEHHHVGSFGSLREAKSVARLHAKQRRGR
jgi:hypothetical protein